MTSRSTQIRFLLQSIPFGERGSADPQIISDAYIQARCEANTAAVDAWASQGGNSRQVKQAGTGLMAICAWHAVKSLSGDANIQAFQKVSGLSPVQFAASAREIAPAFERNAHSQADVPRPSQDDVWTTPKKQASRPGQHSIASSSVPSLAPLQESERTPEALAQRAREIAGGSGSSLFGKRSPATPSSRGRRMPGLPLSGRAYSRANARDGTSPASTPTRSGLRDRSTIREKEVFDPSPAPVTPAITPSKRRGRPPAASSAVAAADSSPQTPSKRVRISTAGVDTNSDATIDNASRLAAANSSAESMTSLPTAREASASSLAYPMTLGYRRHRSDIDSWDASAAKKRIDAILKRVNDVLDAVAERNRQNVAAQKVTAPSLDITMNA